MTFSHPGGVGLRDFCPFIQCAFHFGGTKVGEMAFIIFVFHKIDVVIQRFSESLHWFGLPNIWKKST